MRRPVLLPGVADAECPPIVVSDTRIAIMQARRRAALHDILHLILLGAVDTLFLRFPSTHIPALDRHDSLLLLGAVNGAMVAWLWLARVLPRWTARRIATSWSETERQRSGYEPHKNHQ